MMMLSSAFDASSEGKDLRSIWLRTAKDDCRSPMDVSGVSFGSSISVYYCTWVASCSLVSCWRFVIECVFWPICVMPAPHLVVSSTKNATVGHQERYRYSCREDLILTELQID